MEENQKALCNIINQIFNIEQIVLCTNENNRLSRRFERISEQFKNMNIFISNPINERYNPSRTDCEASITGEGTKDMKIIEVIKPIIFHGHVDSRKIIQRGIVIVQGSK